ncbi:hypothetical protein [Mangrovicoccus ximenensis]|uniref:hypothetical protein n=1 Tax=Mangrovicoccus ximenensis TaxID=1911570 RepID=UPI00191C03F8|nr:hypothetical protein [Mangrovicoccus ximenensis]
MPDIEDMTPGEVLAEASVAEFIKALGLSIAEAQRALDENSVDQIGEFIKPREGLDGKSLLDLGLSPAFYHYQHADISCSMQLSLKVEKDLSVGVNLSGNFSDTTTNSTDASSSESSSESGSSTVTRERSAQMEIQSASTGAVTIGGQNFPLTGGDPLERIRALQRAVTADAQAGVPRMLYRPSDRTFAITTDAAPEKVQVTDKTVTFLGGGFDRAVIQVDADSATDYVFNPSTTVSTTAQGSVPSYADHVAAQVNAAGIAAFVNAPGDPLKTVHFKTGEHHLETFTAEGQERNSDFARRIMDLALFIKQHNLNVEIEGFADAQRYRGQTSAESAQSNRDLGDARAREMQRHLLANGVPAGQMTIVPRARAETLAAAFGPKVRVLDWGETGPALDGAATVVNTTSLGMAGQPPFDLDLSGVHPGMLATDIVYTPLETPFLQAAARRGARIVDGLGMLLWQGVPGFNRWFGGDAQVTPDLRTLMLAP